MLRLPRNHGNRQEILGIVRKFWESSRNPWNRQEHLEVARNASELLGSPTESFGKPESYPECLGIVRIFWASSGNLENRHKCLGIVRKFWESSGMPGNHLKDRESLGNPANRQECLGIVRNAGEKLGKPRNRQKCLGIVRKSWELSENPGNCQECLGIVRGLVTLSFRWTTSIRQIILEAVKEPLNLLISSRDTGVYKELWRSTRNRNRSLAVFRKPQEQWGNPLTTQWGVRCNY